MAPSPTTGVMVALTPAHPEELVVPGGMPADDLHLTLTFHGPADEMNADTLEQIKAIAEGLALGQPLNGSVKDVELFGEDEDVVALTIESKEIEDLRESLVEALTTAGVAFSRKFSFRPHVTLGRTEDIERVELQVGSLIFDQVRVSAGDDNAFFPMGASMAKADDTTRLTIPISKRDDDRRLVFGFAKFAEDPDNRGFLYVDKQQDIITPEDLEESAYQYVLTSRDAGEMHVTKGAASLVESFMVTPEKLEMMGLEPDAAPIGWWVGYKVHEVEKGQPDPWDKIKKGEYTGFSVEGMAVREPIDKRDTDDALRAFAEDRAPTRKEILQAHREGRITQPERDEMLAELVRAERQVVAAMPSQPVMDFLRELFGIRKGDDAREG